MFNKLKKCLPKKYSSIVNSYSQNGEDLIIKNLFLSLGINKPTYIDIGAYHPYDISNTAIFYLNGCFGINIEPNYDNYNCFLRERKRDINLNVGISDKAGSMNYYIIDAPTLNTFSKEIAEGYKEYGYNIIDIKKISVDTIESILNKYFDGIFPDLLLLDAEGFESLILRSVDFEKNHPKVICLETLSFATDGTGEKSIELIQYIKDKGYLEYADTYINTIFVQEKFWRNNKK